MNEIRTLLPWNTSAVALTTFYFLVTFLPSSEIWSERTSSVGHCLSLPFCLSPSSPLSCSHVVLMHKMVILEWVDRGFTVCLTGKLLLKCQSLMWSHWFVVCTNTSSWWHKSVGFTIWLSDSHISCFLLLKLLLPKKTSYGWHMLLRLSINILYGWCL